MSSSYVVGRIDKGGLLGRRVRTVERATFVWEQDDQWIRAGRSGWAIDYLFVAYVLLLFQPTPFNPWTRPRRARDEHNS